MKLLCRAYFEICAHCKMAKWSELTWIDSCNYLYVSNVNILNSLLATIKDRIHCGAGEKDQWLSTLASFQQTQF